jgi:choline dehydrogenase
MVGAISTGQVRLRNADPRERAAVTFNYFAEPEDMDAMVTGIERAREAAASSPIARFVGDEIHAGPQIASRAEIEQEVRRHVEHTYHPSCTARIGTEIDGVVDPELRVHGSRGCGSPMPPSSRESRIATHAPTVMVGEKAADLIRAAR